MGILLISRKILSDLPEWFGLPESTENYIQESKKMPFLACYYKDAIKNMILAIIFIFQWDLKN